MANVLHGISSILNKETLQPQIDIGEMERKYLSGGVVSAPSTSNPNFIDEEMQQRGMQLGINFNSSSFGSGETSSGSASSGNASSSSSSSSSSNIMGAFSGSSPFAQQVAQSSHQMQSNSAIGAGSYASMQEKYASNTDNYDDVDDAGWSDNTSNIDSLLNESSSLTNRTLEQERRSYINAVSSNAGFSDASISFENERKEDHKAQMLEEIDTLLSDLLSDDINIDRVPQVDSRSSYEEVATSLRSLRHKMDSSRCGSIANELILFGASALEDVFDGKRTFFGRYRPDLTDWPNTVRVKLRRMNYDTSQIVSGFVQDNHLGPISRILLELIPSMFLHSRERSRQHSHPGLMYNHSMSDDINNMR